MNPAHARLRLFTEIVSTTTKSATFIMFFQYLWKNPDLYIIWVAVVAFSICVHEFTHAWFALQQGDSTAADNGYMTLNPTKVMGVQSIVVLLIFGIAWGAVPVNHRRMRYAYSPALVACAGPAANLLLAVCFSILTAFITIGLSGPLQETLLSVVEVGVQANCFLLLFNMLPLPMFDGWEFYSWIFPAVKRIHREAVAGMSFFILMLIFITPLGQIFWGISDALGFFLIRAAVQVAGVLF